MGQYQFVKSRALITAFLFPALLGLLLTSAAVADTAGPPTISVAHYATDIASDSATLSADIDPNQSATSFYFEYGLDDNYGATTISLQFQPNPFSASNRVGIRVSGLLPATVYHYRAVAVNAGGTSYGNDHVFRTAEISQQSLPGLPTTTAPAAPVLVVTQQSRTQTARVNRAQHRRQHKKHRRRAH